MSTAGRGVALSALLELVDAVLGTAPGEVGDELAARTVTIAAEILANLPTGQGEDPVVLIPKRARGNQAKIIGESLLNMSMSKKEEPP